MKVFLDGWFNTLTNYQYQFYSTLEQIPQGCELIGTTFYDNCYYNTSQTINQLLDKTKLLLVNLSEPTDERTLRQLLTDYRDLPVRFFSDVVLNFEANNLETIVSWFIRPDNFYATESWATKLLSELTTNWDRPYRFDCLLGSKRRHRDFIQNLYNASPVRDQIIFNYFQHDYQSGIWPFDDFVRLNHNNFIIDGNEIGQSFIVPPQIYNQSYYSIVAETTTYDSYNHYTEKVAKPILARRPFVVFAGRNYLKNLKKLGFQTFDTVIDESYDDVENPEQRWARAWEQVEVLSKQDPRGVYRALQPALEHNKQHFLATDWHKNLRRFFTTG